MNFGASNTTSSKVPSLSEVEWNASVKRIEELRKILMNDDLGLLKNLRRMNTKEYEDSFTLQQKLDDCKENEALLVKHRDYVSEFVRLATKLKFECLEEIKSFMSTPKALGYMLSLQKYSYQLEIPEMRANAELQIQKLERENPQMVKLSDLLQPYQSTSEMTPEIANQIIDILKHV